MPGDRWDQLGRLFTEAVERPAGARAAFVAVACGPDARMRDELSALITAEEASGDFLSTPAIAVFAEQISREGWSVQPGDRIGSYTVERRLGTGGMVRPATRRWPRAAGFGAGAVGLGSIVLAVGPRAAAQAPAAAPPAAQAPNQAGQPTFRLGANYVRVDVYPTRDGEPVQDLGRADFELLEDGVPQTIEQFERISLQPAVDPATRRDPNTITESREQAGDPRRRVFVVFLDTGMAVTCILQVTMVACR